MQAVVNERYGAPDVLEIRDIPTPKPEPGQIRIKVHTTTVGRTDACALRAHPFFMRISSGLIRPKRTVLGFDFAGTVDEVGKGVTRFGPGDRVFGLTADGYGAHAEYLCLSEDGAVCAIPAGKHFDEVVICEGAWYANSNLRQLKLGPGHNILIYGASGAIGSSAVQLAKFYGAEVTAVVSTAHLELVKHLGADHAVDYTTEDLTQIGESFDFVLDAVGKTTFFHCRSLLKPEGVFTTTDLGPWWQNIWLSIVSSLSGSGRVVLPLPQDCEETIQFLGARIEAGDFQAVIDRRYSFYDIAEAYRYIETGEKAGIVVIDIVPET